MIEHLSGEQISQWMIGVRSPHMERHVAECGECRRQLDELESTLSHFRGAMRSLGNSATAPVWRAPAPRATWLSWPRLILAAAMLFLAVSAPVYLNIRARERAEAAARADAQLLEHVNSEISRAVPEPMEPLVNLVTWNSNPAEDKRRAEAQ